MCTIAAGIATSVAGTLFGGLSSSSAANAQASATLAQAQSQANILEYNAAQARADAQTVREQETDAVQQLYNQRAALQGEQRVAAGASGTVAAGGDLANIEIGTFETTEQDLASLRSNYARQISQYVNESNISSWQASNVLQGAQVQASAIRSSGRSSVLGSLLSAGSTVASNWTDLFG